MSESVTDPAFAGAAYPLGAHYDGRGTNFAVFAGEAEEVELCLFDASGRSELRRIKLPECTDGVWHGYVPGIAPGQLYGYRAFGPYEPEAGYRYNGNKLLLDPYARRLAGTLQWSDALYGYRMDASELDLSFDDRDSAASMPKAVVVQDRFDWGHDQPPRTPWAETVIYEAHLRGLTRRHPDIPPQLRGYAAALGHPRIIEHLQRLGITAIELLPVQAFVDDRALVQRGQANYWGYNTLGFFAPDPRYLGNGRRAELKQAIKSLHTAGIEVFLDVVYNHSCEGSELGPTLSFRGLDHAAYYRLEASNPRHCVNDTGCGNTINFSNPRVIQLVMDSLRYWVQEFHVDGFRLDLGVTMGREAHGFESGAGFFDALLQDPTLAQVKLISEPWDLGPGGYQLGNHPAGFSEWNDRFRDDVRSYWRGSPGSVGKLAARLQGSAEVFDVRRRRPHSSVNFITAHDGFTLEDLVSYNHKHNEANGEANRDGTDHNNSFNWGVEGPTDQSEVLERRQRIKRALLATLFFSHGTPMLLGGDEFGRSQLGNNNAYCQDSELSWFDWLRALSSAGREQCEYVARLIRMRRELLTLRSDRFLHGQVEVLPAVLDVQWFNEAGVTMRIEDWQRDSAGVLCLRRAMQRDPGTTEITLLLSNNAAEPHNVVLPPPRFDWWLTLDSSAPGAPCHVEAAELPVPAHAVLLLTALVQVPTVSGRPS